MKNLEDKIDVVLSGEPTGLDICLGFRGWVQFQLETYGKTAHASNPEKGINAIFYMRDFLNALKQVTFGVRPEDFLDKQFYPDATKNNTIKAKAEVVESLGDEGLFYVTSGKHQIVAKLDSLTKVKVGDEIELALKMSETHIFDPENEETLV